MVMEKHLKNSYFLQATQNQNNFLKSYNRDRRWRWLSIRIASFIWAWPDHWNPWARIIPWPQQFTEILDTGVDKVPDKVANCLILLMPLQSFVLMRNHSYLNKQNHHLPLHANTMQNRIFFHFNMTEIIKQIILPTKGHFMELTRFCWLKLDTWCIKQFSVNQRCISAVTSMLHISEA